MVRSMVCAMALCVCAARTAKAQDAKAKGEQIFTDQKCSLCHSIGKGNAKGSLDDVGKKDSPDDIRQWLVDTKAMTANNEGDAEAGDEGVHASQRGCRCAGRLSLVVEEVTPGTTGWRATFG